MMRFPKIEPKPSGYGERKAEQAMRPTQWALGTLAAVGLAAALNACGPQNGSPDSAQPNLMQRVFNTENEIRMPYNDPSVEDPDAAHFTQFYEGASDRDLSPLDRIEIFRMNDYLDTKPDLERSLPREVRTFYDTQGVDPDTYGLGNVSGLGND